MASRTFCDEGIHCDRCAMGAELLKMGIHASFEVNDETGHCDHYTEELLHTIDEELREAF